MSNADGHIHVLRTHRFVIKFGEPLQYFSNDWSPRCNVLRLTIHTQFDEVLQYAQAQPTKQLASLCSREGSLLTAVIGQQPASLQTDVLALDRNTSGAVCGPGLLHYLTPVSEDWEDVS